MALNGTIGAEQIRAIVREIVGAIVSARPGGVREISGTSTLMRDLQFESIDYVVLVETLGAAIPEINFAEWLSVLDPSEIEQLRVEDVAQFITAGGRAGVSK